MLHGGYLIEARPKKWKCKIGKQIRAATSKFSSSPSSTGSVDVHGLQLKYTTPPSLPLKLGMILALGVA